MPIKFIFLSMTSESSEKNSFCNDYLTQVKLICYYSRPKPLTRAQKGLFSSSFQPS